MVRKQFAIRRCAVAAAGAVVVVSGVASAAGTVPAPGSSLSYTASFTIAHDPASAADVAGLSGATITESVTFNAGLTWQSASGNRFAPASNHSITISGASNPLSNGTRWDPDGAGLFYTPGVEAMWIDSLANMDYPTVGGLAGGAELSLGTSLNPVSGSLEPAAGKGIAKEQFGGLRADAFSFFYTNGGAMYSIDQTKPITLSVVGGPTVAVPEPASVAAIGTLGLLVLRRRSK
jgi:hypothetical protein